MLEDILMEDIYSIILVDQDIWEANMSHCVLVRYIICEK